MPFNSKVKKVVLENSEPGGSPKAEISDPTAFYDYARGGVRWSLAPLKNGEESSQRTIKATYYIADDKNPELTLAPKTLETTVTLNQVPEDGGLEGPQTTIGNSKVSAVIGQTCPARQSFTIRARDTKTGEITRVAENVKGEDLKTINLDKLTTGETYDFIVYGRNYVPKKVGNLLVNENTKIDFGKLVVGNVERSADSKSNIDQKDVASMVKEIAKNKTTRDSDFDLNCDGQVEVVDYSILLNAAQNGTINGDTLPGDTPPADNLIQAAVDAVGSALQSVNPFKGNTKSVSPKENPLLK